MEGWIKLYRQMTKWEWYKENNVKVVFLHLLLIANHKQGKWKGYTIERGQLITSYENIAESVGLSIQQVRTAIKKLKSTNEITSKSTNKFTLITIENYDLFQVRDEEITSKSTSNLTNEQQTNNKQITTNKNEKNNKNEKKKKNNSTFHSLEELFDN